MVEVAATLRNEQLPIAPVVHHPTPEISHPTPPTHPKISARQQQAK
jgi:hypothetical protein